MLAEEADHLHFARAVATCDLQSQPDTLLLGEEPEHRTHHRREPRHVRAAAHDVDGSRAQCGEHGPLQEEARGEARALAPILADHLVEDVVVRIRRPPGRPPAQGAPEPALQQCELLRRRGPRLGRGEADLLGVESEQVAHERLTRRSIRVGVGDATVDVPRHRLRRQELGGLGGIRRLPGLRRRRRLEEGHHKDVERPPVATCHLLDRRMDILVVGGEVPFLVSRAGVLKDPQHELCRRRRTDNCAGPALEEATARKCGGQLPNKSVALPSEDGSPELP
mmetsp:Transcript_75191/g.244501  ORF Transcript_75191/g.244501 Transcript_75191/m.244501 type:complete len:280 (-) Transcript_75191:277-1116(-)